MANVFSYKEITTKTLKAVGCLDTDTMMITVDEVPKKLSTLLQEYNGCDVELMVKVKSEQELDEPTEE